MPASSDITIEVPGIERDPAGRVSQAEERRREQARQHRQDEQAGEDARLMREVVERSRRVGEARGGRLGGRARLSSTTSAGGS